MSQTPPGASAPLELTVSEPRPDVVVLSLRGELDFRTTGQVTDCLHELRRSGHAHIVLDLTAVTFMAAAGVAVLLAARDAARDAARSNGPDRSAPALHLLGVAHNRLVRRLLEVFGAQTLFSTFTDLHECLDRL
jgi:anti-anti-sigma factor